MGIAEYPFTSTEVGLAACEAVIQKVYGKIPSDFQVDDIAGAVPAPQPLGIRQRTQVQHQLARMSALAVWPVVRIDSPNSGRYRYLGDASSADIAAAKRRQPRSVRRSRPAKSPPLSDYPGSGEQLDIIESRGDIALARCSNGRVYRIVLEPVLL